MDWILFACVLAFVCGYVGMIWSLCLITGAKRRRLINED